MGVTHTSANALSIEYTSVVDTTWSVHCDTAFGGVSGQVRLITTKTTTYTATVSDDFINADATSGAFTITLFTAVGNSGAKIYIKKIDSSANAITVDADGSETIDDVLTQILTSQYDAITLVSDGTEWWIV